MRVDFHTHITPLEFPDWGERFGAGRWPRLLSQDAGTAMMMMGDTPFMKLDERFWSSQRRLIDMDRQGVGLQVLSPMPILSCYWAGPVAGQAIARFLNEHIAKVVARSPGRFAAMGTVPLQDSDSAVAELRYLRETLKMRAVQIGTCPGERDLDDPLLFPFFEACCDLGVAVFVHPMDPLIGRDRMAQYYLPNIVGNPLETALSITRLICGGVLERLPDLRICFAHGGGAFPFVLGRLDKGFAVRDEMHERIARPPSDYARMIYVDALTFDSASLRLVIEKFGRDRVILGSDYPFLLGDDDPIKAVVAASLDEVTTNAILEGNVWDFLGGEYLTKAIMPTQAG
jgi:aminocarboxymuconate-semialdehyde decarboxylase